MSCEFYNFHHDVHHKLAHAPGDTRDQLRTMQVLEFAETHPRREGDIFKRFDEANK